MIGKIKSPFFKVGKVLGKFGKVAGLSIAGAAAAASFAHFSELLPILVASFGSPWSEIIMMVVGGALAGGGEAVRNWSKHVHISPAELEEILKELWDSDDAVGALEARGMSKKQAFSFLKLLVKLDKLRKPTDG
jgi:hypothetical protein